MTVSFIKRKWNLLTIETKLETIDQLVIEVSISFLAVCYNIGFIIRLSEKNELSKPPLIQIISDKWRSTVYSFPEDFFKGKCQNGPSLLTCSLEKSQTTSFGK